MLVDSSTRRLAIYRILRARGSGKGHCMAMSELQFAWQRTGLRESDLNLGLRELRRGDRVLLQADHRGMRISLTPAGERDARWHGGDWVHLVADWLTLARVRKRPQVRIGPSELLQRRATDRERSTRLDS